MTNKKIISNSTKVPQNEKLAINRRGFIGGVLGTGAVATAGLIGMTNKAQAGLEFPQDPGLFGGGNSVSRSENDLYDCEIEGDFPADLDGAFYRACPDPQYPKPAKYEHDIPFDGEGHVSMFRVKNGHVDYKSRYARTQRWKAQHEARKSLFGMYRNPYTDDPSVAGLSRGTANTTIWYHHGKLLALKEDSPPVAMDPLTLETLDDYYTFNGGLKGETFTAHPKNDPYTGEMIAFGYEAKGLLSNDIELISVDKTGKVTWNAWVKSPHNSMIHDFMVTQEHILLMINPMSGNQQILDAGGPHFAWDSTLPSYMGVLRRGGDGSDVRWLKGPGEISVHTMGGWTDGDKIYYDMDASPSDGYGFFPHLHEVRDPAQGINEIRRVTIDLSSKRDGYDIEILQPGVTGYLSRQDDRYHTLPYRYGFLASYDGSSWAIMDHHKETTKYYRPGGGAALSEMSFVPRRKGAAEGDGYLIGVANLARERRSELHLIDPLHPEDGAIAKVIMPYMIPSQVHGMWIPGDELPSA